MGAPLSGTPVPHFLYKYTSASGVTKVTTEEAVFFGKSERTDGVLAIDEDSNLYSVSLTDGTFTALADGVAIDSDGIFNAASAFDAEEGYYVLCTQGSSSDERGASAPAYTTFLRFYDDDLGAVVYGEEDGTALSADQDPGAVVDLESTTDAVISDGERGGVNRVVEEDAVRVFYSRYPDDDQLEVPKQAEQALLYYVLGKCYSKETDQKFLAKASAYEGAYGSEVRRFMSRVSKQMRAKPRFF